MHSITRNWMPPVENAYVSASNKKTLIYLKHTCGLGGRVILYICLFHIQIDIGERRSSLPLQGLGAKLGGCGTFQVSRLSSPTLSSSSYSQQFVPTLSMNCKTIKELGLYSTEDILSSY